MICLFVRIVPIFGLRRLFAYIGLLLLLLLRFALLNHHSHKHSPTDILKQWRVSLNRDCVADPDALAPFATDYTDNAAAPKPVVKGVYAPKDNGIPFAVSDKSEGYVTTTQVHGQGGEIYGFNCLLSNRYTLYLSMIN